MELDRMKALMDYNAWANGRLIDAVSKLTTEEYTKDLGSSYRSVRDTLVHVMSGEWVWLMRCKGVSPRTMLPPLDFPTISSLKARWTEIMHQQSEFIDSITEESLRTLITYENFQGEIFTYALWQILQHVVNHSSYHRGQVTTLLRQLNAEPIATDFLVFYDLKS